ncbi:hypothetical protein CR513_39156, partial [Mucuna pruriens]
MGLTSMKNCDQFCFSHCLHILQCSAHVALLDRLGPLASTSYQQQQRPEAPLSSHQKQQYRNSKPKGGKAISNGPTHSVLYVNQESVGEKGTKENAKKPPIEEGKLVGSFFGLKLIKLVRSHGRNVGLGSPCAYCNGIKGSEENTILQ